ncbi:hypothetical protein FB567DRAFT_585662 [Paraphoma chrysanthemicola]|uniref:Uncharacterized protein n=1 Tax=Paraphoma chrysanthemicola TaxID=798071 RepID=A0A8K0RFV6_9PLEO|nr:hypothetical protein FB567DRAFT_585662 [Paraphoma chrysanthemicola]
MVGGYLSSPFFGKGNYEELEHCPAQWPRIAPEVCAPSRSLPSWISTLPKQQPQHFIALAEINQEIRVDSALSVCDIFELESKCTGTLSDTSHARRDLVIFNFQFEDQTYTKAVQYEEYRTWDSVERLLLNLEDDGLSVEELWDIREELPICGGDWDARVCPGMEIDVMCRSLSDWKEYTRYESDEKEEDWCWGNGKNRRRSTEGGHKHWWFQQWRQEVEQDKWSTHDRSANEPSVRTLTLGILAMVLFLVAVMVACSS